MRGTGNEKENEETMELAGEYIKKRILPEGKKGYGVVAMDLAGQRHFILPINIKNCLRKRRIRRSRLLFMRERPVARQRWPVPLKWEQQGSDMG